MDVPAAESPHLSKADALRRAIRNSPKLQVSLTRARAALAATEQARLLANPIFALGLRFPEGGGTPQIETGLGCGRRGAAFPLTQTKVGRH